MAEDENAKVGGETVPSSSAPGPSVAGSPAPGSAAEWTASDARGPLNAAGEPLEANAHETLVGDARASHEPSPVSDHASGESPTEHPALADDAVFADASRSAEPGTTPVTSPVAAAPRRSALPIAAAIVVGALIGAGSAAAYYAYAAPQNDEAAQIAALSSRLDALRNRPDASQDIPPLKSAVADLRTKVDALRKDVAQVQASTSSANTQTDQSARRESEPAPTASDQGADKTAAQSGVAANEPAKPAFDPTRLDQKLAALQDEVAAIKRQGADTQALDGKVAALAASVAALNGVDGKVATLQSSLDGLRKQAETTTSSVETLQTNQKTLEGKVTNSPALAVVADSLVEQIARGEPYATQVEALSSIGADPADVAVLKENADKGVPSAKALAAKFEPLADPIVASEHHAAPNAGFWDRLKSGMSSLVSIRGTDDTTGDSLASHVALIQADLAHDDVVGAYAVWSALPAAAKAKSEAWGALAKTHAEAMRAARALRAQAIAALGAKKS